MSRKDPRVLVQNHCTLARDAHKAILVYLGSPCVAEPHGSMVDSNIDELRPLFEALYALNSIIEDGENDDEQPAGAS